LSEDENFMFISIGVGIVLIAAFASIPVGNPEGDRSVRADKEKERGGKKDENEERELGEDGWGGIVEDVEGVDSLKKER
jgi:hypothetical protein